MKKNICFKTLVASTLVVMGLASCNDSWDDHYKQDPNLNPSETIWDIISSRSDLKAFADALEKTGYSTMLQQDRSYTVWVPKTFDCTFPNDSLLKVEFVENHIADFPHVATGNLVNNRVKMLNGKYTPFLGSAGRYTFKGNALVEKNIPAKNGIIHVIDNYSVFTTNIWEALEHIDSLSLINEFLKSYDEVIFDPNQSIEGPIIDGQVTYLDSVTIDNNKWFSAIGRLNREDSTYLMIAPTNKAWREAYAKIKEYYKYPLDNVDGDSLQDELTKSTICKHIVFSKGINRIKDDKQFFADADSLVSNYNSSYSGVKFYNWTYFTNEYGKKIKRDQYIGEVDDLFKDVISTEELSNGTLYVTDKYNFSPFKCWHDTIKIEGESIVSNEESYSSCTAQYVTISRDSVALRKKISNGAYGVFAPTSSRGNPKVTFTIPTVLSAPYLIKIVFVPADIINKNITELAPNKFNWNLQYTPTKSSKTEAPTLGKEISNDPVRLDTLVLVPDGKIDGIACTTDYVTFPTYHEYDRTETEKEQTQLTITSKVSSSDKVSDRTFRIDCIILEPVDPETYQSVAAKQK